MSEVRQAPPRIPAEPSTADLVQSVSEQLSRLVRDELRLARAELMTKGRDAGRGAGLLGGGGLVAMYGVTALLAALVLGLAAVMPDWLAAGLVGVVLLLVAAGLAQVGRGKVRRAGPAVPQETTGSVRRDIDTVTSAVRERGRR